MSDAPKFNVGDRVRSRDTERDLIVIFVKPPTPAGYDEAIFTSMFDCFLVNVYNPSELTLVALQVAMTPERIAALSIMTDFAEDMGLSRGGGLTTHGKTHLSELRAMLADARGERAS